MTMQHVVLVGIALFMYCSGALRVIAKFAPNDFPDDKVRRIQYYIFHYAGIAMTLPMIWVLW